MNNFWGELAVSPGFSKNAIVTCVTDSSPTTDATLYMSWPATTDALPVNFVNAFGAQPNPDGGIYLTLGVGSPPLFNGSNEDVNRQIGDLRTVFIHPVAKFHIPFSRLGYLKEVIDSILEFLEAQTAIADDPS